MRNSLSLYIHIPFCDTLCDYCDFYSAVKKDFSGSYLKKYLDALIADINYQIVHFKVAEIPTVYIGGGTPSVLGPGISLLLEMLNRLPGFSPVEFTVEANPESLTEDFLLACKDNGVNRLSLGVQTFHEASRKAVNRQGNKAELEERLSLASRFYPGALSVDLITGLPHQNKKVVLDDISRLLDYDPAHVSLYSLTLERDTPLEEKQKNKTIALPDMDTADSIWLYAKDKLISSGFNHYEISNFTKPDKMCLHNIRYWQMEGWFGAGPAASGTIIDEKNCTAKRYTYVRDIDAYINAPVIHNAVCEKLDKDALLRETLLMGYRYYKGPDPEKFKKHFGCSIEECIGQTLSRWKNKDKMLFLNSFLSEAFLELDKT